LALQLAAEAESTGKIATPPAPGAACREDATTDATTNFMFAASALCGLFQSNKRGAASCARSTARLLHSWTGAAGDGLGPGRGAGDVDRDHRPDLAIGSYLNSDGAPGAGKIELYSGATGAKLRTIASTTAGENLGFDNVGVGVGDVNRDHRADLLASAAEGDTVYMIAGTGRRGPRR
jgi:hypothetical protein